MFGQTSTNQPTASLFGNTAPAQSQPQAGGSLFSGSTLGQQGQQNQAAAGSGTGTGLFGNTQNQQAGQTGTQSSLFGGFGQAQNQQQQPSAQPGGTNLFSQSIGQQNQPQQQPSGSNSLFGSASTGTNTNTAGIQQPSLFGGFGINSSAPNASTNLFGQSTAQGIQRQPTASNAFGASNTLFKQPSQQP